MEVNHKIMKSRLDGSKKEIVLSNLRDLTSIAVDRDSDRIFFAHARQIDSVDLNGRMRRRLIDHVEVESLAVHKNFLYFVSKEAHVIERIRLNGDDRKNVLARVTPTDIVAVQFPNVDVSGNFRILQNLSGYV